MEEAVIADARGAAAHEGVVELVVTLKHSNGGRSEVALDQLAAAALLSSCDAQTVEELKGQSWSKVRDALSVSWNRFNPTQILNE